MGIDNDFAGSIRLASVLGVFLLGLIPFRKIKGVRRLTNHHNVIGYFFSVAGSIYGILLGLVVVSSISLFDAARINVNAESTTLVSIYMLAENLPENDRKLIRAYCRDYTHSVINNEWATMTTGEHHPISRSYAANLFKEIVRVSENNGNAGQKMLDLGQSLVESRRERLDTSSRSIPVIEWIALCVGGVFVVLFSYFLVTDSLIVQMIGTGMITIMVCLNIYLVVAFASPFSGSLKVSDAPLRKALDTFDHIDIIYQKDQSDPSAN